MSTKRRYRATIDGRDYTIVADKSDDHLNTVVALVNQQLDQLKEVAPELSTQDRAILMAVNAISDQLVQEYNIMTLEEELESLQIDHDAKRYEADASKHRSLPKNNFPGNH